MNSDANKLWNLLGKNRERPRNILKGMIINYRHNYVVQSYIFDTSFCSFNFNRRYYTHLKSAERFAFLEKLKGKEVDIWDNTEKRFI
jgi:hypothetical protein